jgi:predicted O-methyltransferase YrrM
MSLKKLLPAAVRDRLRPTYVRLRRAASSAGRSAVEAIPRPIVLGRGGSDDVPRPKTFSAAFVVAQEEFGIVQIEQEIAALIDFLAGLRPRIVGEIGLRDGGNTYLFLQCLPTLETMISLDVQLRNVARLRRVARRGQRLHAIEGDSKAPGTVRSVARRLGSARFDLLFIDGDHSLDGVAGDLRAYYPLVRAGGAIVFHDIVPARMDAAPDSNLYTGDVPSLWSVVRPHFEHREFVADWGQGGFGIGVILHDGSVSLPQEVGEGIEALSRAPRPPA